MKVGLHLLHPTTLYPWDGENVFTIVSTAINVFHSDAKQWHVQSIFHKMFGMDMDTCVIQFANAYLYAVWKGQAKTKQNNQMR